MKLFKWFAGFFEDQAGSASSKRLIGYAATFYLYLFVDGSLNGKIINEYVFFGVLFLVLFCVGAVTAEFLSKYYGTKGVNSNGTSV